MGDEKRKNKEEDEDEDDNNDNDNDKNKDDDEVDNNDNNDDDEDEDDNDDDDNDAEEETEKRVEEIPDADKLRVRKRRMTVMANDGVMRDVYGFEHSIEAEVAEAEFYASYAGVLQERVLAWHAYALKKGGVKVRKPHPDPAKAAKGKTVKTKVVDPDKAFVPSADLKRLVRMGVPAQYRPSVWLRTSGAYALRAQAEEEHPGGHAGYYAGLVEACENHTSEAIRQIEADLSRTFPKHPSLDAVEVHAAMRRVLVAYSVRNARVGYCQSMNFLVGFMLMAVPEEDAFWLLSAVVETLLPEEFYSPSMVDSTVYQSVFEDLLARTVPKLSVLFASEGVPLPLICSQWFLCLYVRVLPTETTLRVWDAFFYEGKKILFRMGLAILSSLESTILSLSSEGGASGGELYMRVKDMPATLFDCDLLMDIAFNKIGSLSMKRIDKLVRKHRPELVVAYEERVARKGGVGVLPGDLVSAGDGAAGDGAAGASDGAAGASDGAAGASGTEGEKGEKGGEENSCDGNDDPHNDNGDDDGDDDGGDQETDDDDDDGDGDDDKKKGGSSSNDGFGSSSGS